MRTLTLTKQIVKDKGVYTKNRLQIPLPKAAAYHQYKVLMNNQGSMAILYGKGANITASAIQTMLVPMSPVGAGLGAVLSALNDNEIEPLYLAIAGSSAIGDYQTPTSDIDLLLVVRDDDLVKSKRVTGVLRPYVDVVCMSESTAKTLGTGIDHTNARRAKAVIDKIDLTNALQNRPIDWSKVKEYLVAELSFLSSYLDLISLSENHLDRIECTPYILHRLRAVYLVDCLLSKRDPLRNGLTQSLANYDISGTVVRRLYVIARLYQMGDNVGSIPNLERTLLLKVAMATLAYGKDVVSRLG